MENKKIILDLDTGVDDAMAIAYALSAPNLDLIGIVASYGNVIAEQAAQNSLKILELLGATDVPVYIGRQRASHTDHFDRMPVSAHIHGENGIGDVELPTPKRKPETKNGVNFMIDSAKKYGNQLTIIPTGPLTNIAEAIQKAPKTMEKINDVTLMGGALTVPGNVTPWGEANVQQDAEAGDILFESPIHNTMVGLDVTLRTLLTKKETQQWRDLGTQAGKKFADIVDYYINIYDEMYPELGGCSLHDPLAVGVVSDPSMVQILDLDMVVNTDKDKYGRVIGDTSKLNDPKPHSSAAITVDDKRYVKTFMKYLTGLFAKH